MADTKISQLAIADTAEAASFVANVGNSTRRVSIDSITEAVKKSLGYLEKPLIKCRHCGQWGAAYCACAHCGAPIDP